MTFKLTLKPPTVAVAVDSARPAYDPEVDDVSSVLRDICEGLDTMGAQFIVSICSTDLWPTTARTDLAVVMEQLGEVLAGLSRSEAVSLDFYEQGIERVVTLIPHGEDILVECTDMIKKPTSRKETCVLSRDVVVDELLRLCNDFFRVSRRYCKNSVDHPWVVVWVSELRQHAEKLGRVVAKG